MTTAELELVANQLTKKEQHQVLIFAKKLISRRSSNPIAKKYTKEELVSEIQKSYKRAEQGHTKSAYQHLAEIKARHGISA